MFAQFTTTDDETCELAIVAREPAAFIDRADASVENISRGIAVFWLKIIELEELRQLVSDEHGSITDFRDDEELLTELRQSRRLRRALCVADKGSTEFSH